MKLTSNYYKGKNGKAILFLHGFTSGNSCFDIYFKYFKIKGFTVAKPLFSGNSGGIEEVLEHGPLDWLKESKKWIKKLDKNCKEIYVIGMSFGGNLAISLSARNFKKIKAFVILETPFLFNNKINFLLKYIQPIFNFLNIKSVPKNNFFYRKKIKKSNLKINVLPVNVTGQLYRFIENQKNQILKLIKMPCFIAQARNSDLLKKENAEYIYNNILSEKKEIYYIEADNHDLDLLDEHSKILLLEKIYKFIESCD